MNKPVCLGLLILKLNKILMYQFWYDYVNLKYVQKLKLSFMNTGSSIVYIRTDDILEDAETKFDTSNQELYRPLPETKPKNLIRLMKDEFGGKVMTNFVKLREKTYSYLLVDGSEDKKAKVTKKCVIKSKVKLGNSKNCLEVTQFDNKIKYLGKNKTNTDIFKRNHEEFIRKTKQILKTR